MLTGLIPVGKDSYYQVIIFTCSQPASQEAIDMTKNDIGQYALDFPHGNGNIVKSNR